MATNGCRPARRRHATHRACASRRWCWCRPARRWSLSSCGSVAEGEVELSPRIELLTPDTPARLDEARAIMREYATQLGFDLCFQDFEGEIANLPGEYAAPDGALLLALVDGELAGCG